MNNPVLILYLEDDPRDVELAREKLQQTRMACQLRVARDRAEYEAALAQTRFDLILSDYSLPDCDGLAALALARAKQPEVPFLLISGTLGEEQAVDCVLRGATDYVLKQRLDRLVPAVFRVLAEAEERQKRREAEESLCASELRYRRLFEAAKDGILILDAETGMIVDVNSLMINMLGYSREAFLAKKVWELGFFKDIVANQANFAELQQQGYVRYEDKALETSDGRRIEVEFVSNVYVVNHQKVIQCIIRDVTERKRAQQALRESEEKHRLLYVSSQDAIMTLAPPTWRFTGGNPAAIAMFAARDEAAFCAAGPWEVSPERQPDGELSSAKAQRFIQTAVTKGTHFFEWTHRRLNGAVFPATVLLNRVEHLGQVFLQATVRDITEQKRAEEALRLSERFVRGTLDALAAHVCVLDQRGTIIMVNQAWRKFADANPPVRGNVSEGASYLEVCDQARNGSSEAAAAAARAIRAVLCGGKAEFTVEYPCHAPDQQRWFIARVTRFAGEGPVRVVVAHENITDRKRAEHERALMQAQVSQAQKLESIGQLAAGIAHEINTPTQYIGDNTHFLQDLFAQMSQLLNQYARLLQAVQQHAVTPQLVREVTLATEAADAAYLLKEIPKSIEQTLQGVERVSNIVRAMRDFSHPGTEEKTNVDLNRALESTATVARNEWKYVAELQLDLDPRLPAVPCLPGEINQVFLNLIMNAAQAVGDVVGDGPAAKGRIQVRTRAQENWVEIRIQDTGPGIPDHVRSRIFDPFFTTKPVGKGTGQGLAIARSVVVDKHGGTLRFETEMGQGTTFIVRLPLHPSPPARGRTA